MMDKSDEIRIKLSKIKLAMLFTVACLFVALGFWLLFGDHSGESGSYSRYQYVKSPVFRFPVGILSIVFCGSIAILIFIKFFDSKPGLIINNEGIYDNSSGLSLGIIFWNDIKAIETVKVQKQKFILIKVKNPHFYLKSNGNFLKTRGAKMNYRYYGTPICISANSLNIKFQELYTLLLKMKENFDMNDNKIQL